MSKIEKQYVTCPKCGKQYEINVYSSINGTLDPDLKEKLLNDEIFRYECPYCHNVYMFSYQCLYHDIEKKFMVYLINEKNVDQIKQMDMPKKIIDEYTLRMTFNIQDFIEKVKIFDDNVDDRVVEVAKLVSLQQFDKQDEEIQFAEYNKKINDEIEIIIVTDKDKYGMRLSYPDLVAFVGLNDSFIMPKGFQIVNAVSVTNILNESEKNNG